MDREPGIELFRIRDVAVAIHPSWLVIFLLVLWSLSAGYFPRTYPGHGWGQYVAIGAAATFLFFASVLLHELSHAWIANRSGQPVINVVLAVFNLLPGFPLDGGRILRALLWMRWKDLRRATAVAASSGSGIGFGIIALGVLQIFFGGLVGGLWLVFIGMFLRSAAGQSYQGVVVDEVLSSASVRELMIRDPVVVPEEISVQQAVEEHFLRHGFGGYPVSHDESIAGIVSLREVRDCPREERPNRPIRDIMRPIAASIAVDADATAADALKQMVEEDSGRLLVTDKGRAIGLITRTGITRFLRVKTILEGEARAVEM